MWPKRPATPSLLATAAHWYKRAWTASQATFIGDRQLARLDKPINGVNAAAEARDRAAGCSSASSRRSQSRAAGVESTLWAPATTTGTPARPGGLDDYRLAVGPDQDADVAGATTDARFLASSPAPHDTTSAPDPSNETTSPARSSATQRTAEPFCTSRSPVRTSRRSSPGTRRARRQPKTGHRTGLDACAEGWPVRGGRRSPGDPGAADRKKRRTPPAMPHPSASSAPG